MTPISFPSISVIIPAYNRAKTIRRCLDSITSQTVSPLEIIVVDDGSSDGTNKIVQTYGDARVRCIILDKNRGAQTARNCGIREAKGDWVAFQDSDDEWLSEKLERQIEALAGYQFDPWVIVHTNVVCRGISRTHCPLELPLVEGADMYGLLLTKPGPMFQGMLVSRLALQKINLLDESIVSFQEWDTSIRLARYCRFVYLREPLFIYDLQANNTISKNKQREITGYQQVVEKFKTEIIKECGVDAWENHLYIQLFRCLDYRLWSDADKFLGLIKSRTIKRRVIQLFRLFHISPEPAMRFLKLLQERR